jgi:hypothetical protein
MAGQSRKNGECAVSLARTDRIMNTPLGSGDGKGDEKARSASSKASSTMTSASPC